MIDHSPGAAPCVLLLGVTGTIGRATAASLLARGYRVICPLRSPTSAVKETLDQTSLTDAEFVVGDVTDSSFLTEKLFQNCRFDAIVSCLASRSGEPNDAWAIDYRAHKNLLAIASSNAVKQFVLLSAICVQKPKLAFQQAKLAFEKELSASGLTYSIVRPTAFFKSLSGQVARVRAGKAFLIFGDGQLTACKPISDADLANYLVDCLEQAALQNRILPIGGPGPAMTPRQQGRQLFELLEMDAHFQQVPPGLLAVIATILSVLGKVLPSLATKAELAKIGHYYATESMLVWDRETGRYSADATPETGKDRLVDYYRQLIDGSASLQLGNHAVFSDPKQRARAKP